MQKLIAVLCLTTLSLVALTTSSAVGAPPSPIQTFTIDLDGVSEDEARADLVFLFIRERQNDLRIDLTLTNRLVTVGRSRPTLYYLENLRVRPGTIVRIKPGGRVPDFEARIQTIEARFPAGKPPQLFISAIGEPIKDHVTGRPYPRLATEGFNGRRTLVETGQPKTRKPDLITCFGDTPGDLRIRFHSLVDVENVGRAFSTTYVIDDIQHRYDPNNGLQSRYQGTRYIAGDSKSR